MRPASSATGAECPWWTNSSVARWTRSTAAIATTPNSLAVAMDAARSSVPVRNVSILQLIFLTTKRSLKCQMGLRSSLSNVNTLMIYLCLTRILQMFIAIYSMHANDEKCENAVSICCFNDTRRFIEIAQSFVRFALIVRCYRIKFDYRTKKKIWI